MQQEITAIFNQAAHTYTVKGLRDDEWTLVDALFPKGGDILVVGCGTGRTVLPLVDLGFKVTGLDISPEMIHWVRGKATYLVGDISTFETDQRFDVIFCPFFSLDFVAPKEHRDQALQNMRNLLKPGGTLIYSFHNRLFPRTFRQWLKQRFGPYAKIKCREGNLWTYTAIPGMEKRKVAKLFPKTELVARYDLLPSRPMSSWKERLMRVLTWFDKMVYVIAHV